MVAASQRSSFLNMPDIRGRNSWSEQIEVICFGMWRSLISAFSFPEWNDYGEVPVSGDDILFPDECEKRK